MDKAQRAINLLMDDFFIEEVAELKDGYTLQIINSDAEDYDVRETAYRNIKAIDAVMAHFQAIADTKLVEKKRWKIL